MLFIISHRSFGTEVAYEHVYLISLDLYAQNMDTNCLCGGPLEHFGHHCIGCLNIRMFRTATDQPLLSYVHPVRIASILP